MIIRRGKHTPYYLQKDYYESSPKEKLRAGAIYTRTADINTPKECTAIVCALFADKIDMAVKGNKKVKKVIVVFSVGVLLVCTIAIVASILA